MPLKRSSSGLVGASLIVIIIDPDKHFIRTVGSFVEAGSRSVECKELNAIIATWTEFDSKETIFGIVISNLNGDFRFGWWLADYLHLCHHSNNGKNWANKTPANGKWHHRLVWFLFDRNGSSVCVVSAFISPLLLLTVCIVLLFLCLFLRVLFFFFESFRRFHSARYSEPGCAR